MPIFISYSSHDPVPYAQRLCHLLDAHKVPRWDIVQMREGGLLETQIRSAIETCEACVFVATKGSVNSKWCMAEVGAFWGSGKPVIIYMAGPDVSKEDLPPQFLGALRTDDDIRVVEAAKSYLEAAQAGPGTPVEEVYSDVEHVLNKLERESGGQDLAFKIRRELNLLHLGRTPAVTAVEVKTSLNRIKMYPRADDELDAFNEEITPRFVEAVMDFQRRERTQQVDGIVGINTKRLLRIADSNA